MKYRLNFDWNGYKKGQIFERLENGSLCYYKGEELIGFFVKEQVDLLLLSGALTEVKENTCMHHTNPYNCDCFKNLGKEKLREEWRTEVKKWPQMDALGSADWWLQKLDQALTDKVASIRGEIDNIETNWQAGNERHEWAKQSYRQAQDDILNLPSLLPASREENG